MKKLLLLLMIAYSGLSASAQIKHVKFGVKSGLNLPKISYSDGSETERRSSIYMGAIVDIPIVALFSIQPGIIYTGKGSKLSSGNLNIASNTETTRLNYIEIPVNALLNLPLCKGNVFVGAGPYYAVGVSGEIKQRKLQFGKDGDLRRSDFGLNFLAGYEFDGGFNIHAGYGLGLYNHKLGDNLIDLSGNTRLGSKRNNVLSFGVGFFY